MSTVSQTNPPLDLASGDGGSESRQHPSALDAVLARARELVSQQQTPTATYRVQLHPKFGFADTAQIVPYLAQLGISHVYASPFLKARHGSTHGYDIVDHSQLNPELGTADDFNVLVETLHRHGMGLILDVVPNHMGVGSDENPWWQDVLENGRSSSFANFFDIDWEPIKPDLHGKVLLPVLGDQFGQVLESQGLVLHFADGSFQLTYFQRKFPLTTESFAQILQHDLESLTVSLADEQDHLLEYQSILTALDHLPPAGTCDPERVALRQREQEVIKRRLRQLSADSPTVVRSIEATIQRFNGRAGEPESFDLLDRLLQVQPYRLSFWKVAADEINYRRFFDVNELAAVAMERPEVFTAAHAFIFELIDVGKVDGLRIDHADGLYDPLGYLWQLQEKRFWQLVRRAYDEALSGQDSSSDAWPTWEALEPALSDWYANSRLRSATDLLVQPLFVVVEKILEVHEKLSGDWPVRGTTGYEFLNQLNGLYVDSKQAKAFETIYARFLGAPIRYDDLVHRSKVQIMKFSLSGELSQLGHRLDRISESNRRWRDFTLNGLMYALREVVACFGVYRTYVTAAGVQDTDRSYVQQAVTRAKRRNPAVNDAVFDFIRDMLLMEGRDQVPPQYQNEWIHLAGLVQQFTSPVAAKGVEDTAFYVYNRLVSLNEVGGSPSQFGMPPSTLHQANLERQALRPFALLATSTHDTKRSEDVRARINVLSEIPRLWRERVLQWTRWNKRKKTKVDGELAPSRNDEYLLYQTLLGTWPSESPHGEALSQYVERIQQYMLKALREGKVQTSWIAPYQPYEEAVTKFVADILADEPLTAFRTDFEPFAQRMARCGIWNSLSQTLIKLTSPGAVDLYQGTELLDFSLVDPDNRRPVDYQRRRELLNQLRCDGCTADERLQIAQTLVEAPDDGALKLLVVAWALKVRREVPALFTVGEYIPLTATGSMEASVFTFARRQGDEVAIIVAPRLIHALEGGAGKPPLGDLIWGDTQIQLPPEWSQVRWTDVFTGLDQQSSTDNGLRLADVCRKFPVALLRGQVR